MRHGLARQPPAARHRRWRRVDGRRGAARAAASKAKGLRRLRAKQPVARHGLHDRAVVAALQRVGDRHRGDGARRVAPAPPAAPAMVPGGMNGRAASCTSTMSGAMRAPAPPARRATLSCRVAPPGNRGQMRRARPAPRSIGAASPTGCSSVDMRPQRLGGMPDHRLARRSIRNCLGVSAPKRLPVPAATRMAAIRMPEPMPPAAGGVNRRGFLLFCQAACR